MSKNLVLMRDVICLYHPSFKVSPDLRKFGLEMPERFNIERLIEESLADNGKLKFIDADGYDFLPDYSDSKTTTININTRRAEIGNVETKIGPLRITAYNPHKDGVDYFYVPKAHLKRVREPCYGNNSHKERIQFGFSSKSDSYGWFDDYRVDSFAKLARARG
jgi:hypothetical protein